MFSAPWARRSCPADLPEISEDNMDAMHLNGLFRLKIRPCIHGIGLHGLGNEAVHGFAAVVKF
jgi:hypothetical protein